MSSTKKNLNQDKIKKNTRQSVAWFTVLPSLLHVIRFVNSIILARILSPADFGIVGIATVLLYYSNSITEFGMAKAIIQKKDVLNEHYNAYFSFNIAISLVLYVLFNIFSLDIAMYFHEPLLEKTIEVVALLFPISALAAIPMTELRRDIKFKSLAIIEAIKVFVSMCISLTLAMNGFGFWSLIFAMVTSHLVAMILMRYHSTVIPRLGYQMTFFKELLHFGKWDFVWGQAKILSDNLDKILIGRMLDITQLGLFEKAQGLAKMPYEQFSTRLGMVSFSSFSRLQDNRKELINYLSKMMVLNAFISFPVYFGFSLVAENLTFVLLGEKWMGMVVSLQALSLSFLISSLMSPIISMNIAMGEIKKQALIRVVGLVFFTFALLWAVPYGIAMVSYVTIAFNSVLMIASFILLNKVLNISLKAIWGTIYPSFMCSALMSGVVLYAINFIYVDHAVINLFVAVALGGLTYLVSVLMFRFEQLEFIRSKLTKYIVKVK